jgi:hypothetical protein
MSAEELSSLREYRRRPDQQQRNSAERSARPFLRQIDQEPFQQGYVAGWQSVRGVNDHPLLVPQSPVLVAHAMYMVGFSRGARDAAA